MFTEFACVLTNLRFMHLKLIAAEKSLCYDANAFRGLIEYRSRAEEAI